MTNRIQIYFQYGFVRFFLYKCYDFFKMEGSCAFYQYRFVLKRSGIVLHQKIMGVFKGNKSRKIIGFSRSLRKFLAKICKGRSGL